MLTAAVIALILLVLALTVWTLNRALDGCIFAMLQVGPLFDALGLLFKALGECLSGE